MILGIGTDIIEISRIAISIERHGDLFIDRLFTAKEKSYAAKFSNRTPTFAGRFAAKEAIVKALGTGIRDEMSWQEIEIINDEKGKPEVFFSEKLQKILIGTSVLISISHSKEYATATAIWQKNC